MVFDIHLLDIGLFPLGDYLQAALVAEGFFVLTGEGLDGEGFGVVEGITDLLFAY